MNKQNQQLPQNYRGYPVQDLLALWGRIKDGTAKNTPREMVLAMRGLLREYKLSAVFQIPADFPPETKTNP